MNFIIRWIVTAVAVGVAVWIVPGISAVGSNATIAKGRYLNISQRSHLRNLQEITSFHFSYILQSRQNSFFYTLSLFLA